MYSNARTDCHLEVQEVFCSLFSVLLNSHSAFLERCTCTHSQATKGDIYQAAQGHVTLRLRQTDSLLQEFNACNYFKSMSHAQIHYKDQFAVTFSCFFSPTSNFC